MELEPWYVIDILTKLGMAAQEVEVAFGLMRTLL